MLIWWQWAQTAKINRKLWSHNRLSIVHKTQNTTTNLPHKTALDQSIDDNNIITMAIGDDQMRHAYLISIQSSNCTSLRSSWWIYLSPPTAFLSYPSDSINHLLIYSHSRSITRVHTCYVCCYLATCDSTQVALICILCTFLWPARA